MEFQTFDLKHSYSLLSWLTELFSADEYYVLPRLPFFMILSYSLCEHRKTCQRRIQAFKNGKSNRNQHMRTINVHPRTIVRALWGLKALGGCRTLWGPRNVGGPRTLWGPKTLWGPRTLWGSRTLGGPRALIIIILPIKYSVWLKCSKILYFM